jgi:phosphoserine aminotransferase
MVANLVQEASFHFVNGAFSEKAREASRLLGKSARSVETPWGEQCDFFSANIPASTELITVCYNETSTGVATTASEIRALKKLHPKKILAVDITSCGGCVPLTISDADIWYFSVQKAFGLPAGLGIAIISPHAYERALSLAHAGKNLAGIWAWEELDEMMSRELYQTPQTPNVLNIYLLGKQCARWNKDGGLRKRAAETRAKSDLMTDWTKKHDEYGFFVRDAKHRSETVFVLKGDEAHVAAAHARLKNKGIELGAGYGKIKKDTFRIANFPAIRVEDIEKTLSILVPR